MTFMKMNKSMIARCLLGLLLALPALSVSALCGADSRQSAESLAALTPHQVVDSVTKTLMDSIAQYRDTFDKQPQAFFDELDCTLSAVVDFGWISRNVMGKYGKQATPEQRARFTKAFRADLIETYGRGLITFGDQKIEVLPPKKPVGDAKRATVTQQIHSEGAVMPVYYSMAKSKTGQWKISNVIISGINLGITFRNQFAQRVQKHGGDIDKVIDSWSSAPVAGE